MQIFIKMLFFCVFVFCPSFRGERRRIPAQGGQLPQQRTVEMRAAISSQKNRVRGMISADAVFYLSKRSARKMRLSATSTTHMGIIIIFTALI